MIQKQGEEYIRIFREDNISVAMYQNGIVKTGTWNFEFQFSSTNPEILSNLRIQELSINEWIRRLFDQKFLVTEESDYTSHFSNRVVVTSLEIHYIVQIVELILKPHVPDGVNIQSISLHEL